ncbi:hypothetical protein, partial [Salmonella sp. gx-f7]|uniref:hypothetical protein n=1 Tax=Salmonella sp. gx-f7 TaxID=2582606 RepID=UPI001F21BC79
NGPGKYHVIPDLSLPSLSGLSLRWTINKGKRKCQKYYKNNKQSGDPIKIHCSIQMDKNST